MMQEIRYTVNGKGTIRVPNCAPFDGKPVLIKLAEGWCEAWWDHDYVVHVLEGPEYKGFCWVCLDDKFQAELDEATHWAPLPTGDAND